MTTRYGSFAFGEYYHIYNRGVDKRIIFNDDSDSTRFIELLFLTNSIEPVNVRNIHRDYKSVFDVSRGEPLVHIGAYCLMPNHFHLLLTPAVDRGLERFMLKLGTGYAMYFNKRYERTGSLFEGRFKSQHASSDEYLKYLFSYIHLNPIKLIQSDWKESGIRDLARAKQYLDEYGYSSLHDYLGTRDESVIIEPDKFPEYFLSKKEIDSELIGWLTYREELYGGPASV
jgi:putative transposase